MSKRIREVARATAAALLAIPVLMGSANLAEAEGDKSLKLFFTHRRTRDDHLQA